MRIKRTDRKKPPMGWWIFGLFFGLGVVLNSPGVVWAHKVYLYAWVDGDTIYTESYFGAKGKVIDGMIRVFDPSGKMLLEGRTNEQGEFSFKCPLKTDLRIEVEAGMGHKGEYMLKAEELSDLPGADIETVKADTVEKVPPPSLKADAEQIRTVVEQALDSRLKPIKRELAAIRKEKSPGLSEIIGGIGYIFGVMGLVMYFRGRKKQD